MESNQQSQQELLEIAREMPGVEDAIEVFERVQPYLQRPVPITASIRYATGGNPNHQPLNH